MTWLWYIGGALIFTAILYTSTSSAFLMRVFYGKPLFTDSSAQERAKVEAAFKKENVRYYVETIKNKPTHMQGRYANDYMRINMPHSQQDAGISLFVYRIYVPRRYRAKAELVLSTAQPIA